MLKSPSTKLLKSSTSVENFNNTPSSAKKDSHQDEFYDNYFSYYTNRKENEQTKYRILMNCLYWFGFSSDVYFGTYSCCDHTTNQS